ncbi:NUDIX hydrolase [Saccharopolyspora phatthalungensis]|uniref:8-oxo-dGTP pyrophosphatase MutT (NUDIX family) n=1 Tax=Saccharopolyspora phatthalungensis TaxID=664693 RepID=A0A840QJK9_9PSEU|nr:NUDIX hydrolase [Saccharopolyspora phatthalungensis]MBB5158073.1 8-oxo-dGTP pyrophosphatase MutT (NUDIX family) [Saccharopolyspora phatthalungensis]
MTITTEHISQALKAYLTNYPEHVDDVQVIADLIAEGVDITPRTEFRGHATAGAVLLNESGQVLHIRHRALGKWLRPGGHLEHGDESLCDAALRELDEETGIKPEAVTVIDDVPIHVDVHTIDANPEKGEPEHQHFDFRFLFRTTSAVGELQEAEVTGADWFPVDTLPGQGLRERVRAAVASRNS